MEKRNRFSKEKPVINENVNFRFLDEPYDFITAYMPGNNLPLEEKKADEKPPTDERLKESIRLFKMRRWEQAYKEFQKIKSENFSVDDQIELAYFLGLCCTKLEKFEDAIIYLEQVIAAGSDALRSYQCRMTVAYIYLVTKRSKMAEYELKRLKKNGFESASLYNSLAYASYIEKQYKKAIDLYEKALELDENNATAINCIGFILADSGIDRMRGLRYCRKAVDINPQSAAYLDSLGWAYYKCGETAEARTWLRRALQAAPHEKEIKEHLRIVSGGTR